MRALVYHGSNDVRVDSVPDPIMTNEDDIILKVTATAICGSDLHILAGKVPKMKDGDILGHEFMGIVEETGKNVTAVKKGDRVVVPFVIACGDCFFCQHDYFSACENTNPNEGGSMNRNNQIPGAAMFGYSHLYGGIPEGQAEYVRVPNANVGPFKIPDGLLDEKVLFLTDILPTGYQAVLNANVGSGDSIAIFGAGPVGLMSAACAKMLGVKKIFMVDECDYRLDFAKKSYDVIPINLNEIDDPAKFIIEQTENRGVDAAIDAVGFEAKGSLIETTLANLKMEGGSGEVLRNCIACVRRCGTVSVPGVYAGFLHKFMFGDAFDKGLTFKMGQTHVQKYLPELLKHIEKGGLNPEIIVTHVLSLEDAEYGYDIFNKKKDHCRKVILKPELTKQIYSKD